MTGQRDFEAAEALVRDSMLVAIIDGAARLSLRAAAQSSLLSSIAGPVARYREAPAVDRIRIAAVAVLTLAVAELVFLRIVPRQVAPSLPFSFWVLAAVASTVAAACARPLATAWQSSLLRRLGRAVRAWAQPSA